MKESWFAESAMIRQIITEYPSESQTETFLRTIVGFERKIMANLTNKSGPMKEEFRELVKKLKAKGKQLTLAEYCRHILDNIAEKNVSHALGSRSDITFVLVHDFFAGARNVLLPITNLRTTERQMVAQGYKFQQTFGKLIGNPDLSLSSVDFITREVKIHQDLMREDSTGFTAIDVQLEAFKASMPEPLRTDPHFRVMIAGAEFGNRVYKKLYTALSS